MNRPNLVGGVLLRQLSLGVGTTTLLYSVRMGCFAYEINARVHVVSVRIRRSGRLGYRVQLMKRLAVCFLLLHLLHGGQTVDTFSIKAIAGVLGSFPVHLCLQTHLPSSSCSCLPATTKFLPTLSHPRTWPWPVTTCGTPATSRRWCSGPMCRAGFSVLSQTRGCRNGLFL